MVSEGLRRLREDDVRARASDGNVVAKFGVKRLANLVRQRRNFTKSHREVHSEHSGVAYSVKATFPSLVRGVVSVVVTLPSPPLKTVTGFGIPT